MAKTIFESAKVLHSFLINQSSLTIRHSVTGLTLILTLLLNHIVAAEDVAIELCTLALLEFNLTG